MLMLESIVLQALRVHNATKKQTKWRLIGKSATSEASVSQPSRVKPEKEDDTGAVIHILQPFYTWKRI